MIRSVFSKIFLSHLFVLAIFAGSIALLLVHFLTGYLIDAKREDLTRSGLMEVRYLMELNQQQQKLPVGLLETQSRLSGTSMWIMDENQHILAGSPPVHWQRYQLGHPDAVGQSLFQGEITSQVQSQNDGLPVIWVSIPFPNTKDRVLMLYAPVSGTAKTPGTIEKMLLLALVGAVLFAGLVAFVLSRNVTRPIHDISTAAIRFSKRDYSSRTTAVGPDEIGQLGRIFNGMAEDIERKERNSREFFSDVTHELKTPLAAIQAITESILDGVVSMKQARERYLDMILHECRQMSTLISEILLLEQLETAGIEFHWADLELKPFLRTQQEKYRPLLEEKMLRLEFALDTPQRTIRADADRLEQVLNNLLSNAIRYSFPGGRILLKVWQEGNSLHLSVTDHGEGIPADSIPYLWERFYRVDKSRSRHRGGTGLGLAVTKKLVEGMAGEIQVTSNPGVQTVFTVILPLNIRAGSRVFWRISGSLLNRDRFL